MVIYQNKHYRKQNKYTSYKEKKKIHYSLGNKDFQRKPEWNHLTASRIWLSSVRLWVNQDQGLLHIVDNWAYCCMYSGNSRIFFWRTCAAYCLSCLVSFLWCNDFDSHACYLCCLLGLLCVSVVSVLSHSLQIKLFGNIIRRLEWWLRG